MNHTELVEGEDKVCGWCLLPCRLIRRTWYETTEFWGVPKTHTEYEITTECCDHEYWTEPVSQGEQDED